MSARSPPKTTGITWSLHHKVWKKLPPSLSILVYFYLKPSTLLQQQRPTVEATVGSKLIAWHACCSAWQAIMLKKHTILESNWCYSQLAIYIYISIGELVLDRVVCDFTDSKHNEMLFHHRKSITGWDQGIWFWTLFRKNSGIRMVHKNNQPLFRLYTLYFVGIYCLLLRPLFRG